jgi:hypothetical protein
MTFAHRGDLCASLVCIDVTVVCDSFTDEEDWGRVVLTIILIDLRDYE